METKEKRPLQDRAMRIRRIAGVGSILCLCLAILIPGIVIGVFWLTDIAALSRGLGIETSTSIEYWKRLGVVMTLAMPACIFAVSLLWLRTAFVAFGSANYFSPKAFDALLRFSKWLGASVLLSILCQTLAPFWLGSPRIAIQFGSSEFMTLGVAALIFLLANILALASEIEAENRQFV